MNILQETIKEETKVAIGNYTYFTKTENSVGMENKLGNLPKFTIPTKI